MAIKKHFNKLLFLFIVNSILCGPPCGLASAQDWNRWFSQFAGVGVLTVSEDADRSLHSQDKTTSQVQSGFKSELADWLTFSANLDSSYRNTNFYKSGHHTIISQGDSRLEFWMPPNRNEFSWGPYVRFAGLTSDHSQAWENAWLAQPGFGVQVYPFSSAVFRKKKAAEVVGPVRLFAEHNRMDYWGSENIWRPDEQFRAGADYWKALYVNDIYRPWWAEIWSGLFCQSANEFDKDYNTLILGNAVRVGLRKPDAGVLSMLTPYLAMESSLTENGSYYWENRLWLGGGIRFAPRLYEREGESNWLTRFVVYAEHLSAAAYYRDSAPSSVPDYDFRVGISLSIGEWFR